MAAKTEFSQNELSAILAHYSLGAYQGAKAFTSGTVQTNLLLQTTEGNFVFRYYENRTKESALFESNLIKYLRDRKYPCPAPFRNKHGHFVGAHNGKPYAIFEFVEGHHLEHPSERQKKQLIRMVAELQNLTKHYRPRNKKYRWNYSVELCRELAQKEAQKIATANAEAKLRWLERELSELHLPQSLPKGICHCDFHFSNVLFKDGQFRALLDFDDANYTFLTFDLATLIDLFIPSFTWNTWPEFQKDQNIIDFRAARNIVAEYVNHRPLSNSEKRHFFDVYKLSIMFDCVWYFERGTAADFYEKRKIESLASIGKDEFYSQLFGAD